MPSPPANLAGIWKGDPLNANARKAQADGESAYIRETGAAKGAEVEAIGLARAEGYESQVKALGPVSTTIVNALNALAESRVRFVPDVLVSGGNGMTAVDALAGVLTKLVNGHNGPVTATRPIPGKAS
jgi:uncharacterized membrane protein YqiK